MPIKTVLIIDDSPTERHILSQLLIGAGYETVTAESGEEGIARAKQVKPDLVLMDVVMPGINGFQATRALSKDDDTKDIPVIMCTTKDQETDRVWGMRQGAVDYMVKPVSGAELVEKAQAALAA